MVDMDDKSSLYLHNQYRTRCLVSLVAKQENEEVYKWILGSKEEGVKLNTRRQVGWTKSKKDGDTQLPDISLDGLLLEKLRKVW